jgi:hypothetical protein
VTVENNDSVRSLMSLEEEMTIILSIPVLENELTWICRVTDESLCKSDLYEVDENNKTSK